jgi:hypothetical protein
MTNGEAPMSRTSRIPSPRLTAPVAHVNGGTHKVRSAEHDEDVARRLDTLDARIWAAARRRGDPQLAVGAAREFAREVFVALILRAGDGRHRVNCSVPVEDGSLNAPADLPMSILIEIPAVSLPRGGVDEEIRELVALSHVTGASAVLILRTFDSGGEQGGQGGQAEGSDTYTVRGWRITGGGCEPLDAAGMFAFCCSEASSGEPLPIHPGSRYADALPLPAVSPRGS